MFINCHTISKVIEQIIYSKCYVAQPKIDIQHKKNDNNTTRLVWSTFLFLLNYKRNSLCIYSTKLFFACCVYSNNVASS